MVFNSKEEVEEYFASLANKDNGTPPVFKDRDKNSTQTITVDNSQGNCIVRWVGFRMQQAGDNINHVEVFDTEFHPGDQPTVRDISAENLMVRSFDTYYSYWNNIKWVYISDGPGDDAGEGFYYPNIGIVFTPGSAIDGVDVLKTATRTTKLKLEH